jgi:NAD(P)-dependent dehydrogenase (short-subunit alcohol dehydrogenase family)
MLQKAEEGHIVNTSSVNGFWASVGPRVRHTAYSAAKFAFSGAANGGGERQDQ